MPEGALTSSHNRHIAEWVEFNAPPDTILVNLEAKKALLK